MPLFFLLFGVQTLTPVWTSWRNSIGHQLSSCPLLVIQAGICSLSLPPPLTRSWYLMLGRKNYRLNTEIPKMKSFHCFIVYLYSLSVNWRLMSQKYSDEVNGSRAKALGGNFFPVWKEGSYYVRRNCQSGSWDEVFLTFQNIFTTVHQIFNIYALWILLKPKFFIKWQYF